MVSMNQTHNAGDPHATFTVGVQPPGFLVCSGCGGHVHRTTNGKCGICEPYRGSATS